MAYTTQEQQILAAGFASLAPEVRELLNNKSIADTQAAIATISSQLRSTSMSTAIASLVTVSTSDRAALRTAADVADGATLPQLLVAFNTALESDNLPLHTVFAVAFAAMKNHGIR